MLEIILTIGIPASAKSTWAKAKVAEDPKNWVRINNDQIREMLNGSVFDKSYEKIVDETRDFLIRTALKHDKHIIIDNLNLNDHHFKRVCSIAKDMNKDITVLEKHFYVELDEAIARDAKRDGHACVGEKIIKHWYNKSGKEKFKDYQVKTETFYKRTVAADKFVKPMEQDESLPRAVIFDNDGTISLIHSGRSPYDASTADRDLPHMPVIECMKLYYNAGYKILFVSGREEKDRAPTERFYQQHFPEVKYELFMRQTNDKRKDVLVKEEIFNNHIKGKYFVAGWYDDRLQVAKWVYENGLGLFRVGDPEAVF